LARGSVGPREFVRFTPGQFSILMAIVVLLMAGSGVAGYLYGIKEAGRESAQVLTDTGQIGAETSGSFTDTAAEKPSPVTFYTALTQQKEGIPSPSPPAPKPSPPAPEEKTAQKAPPPLKDGGVILQIASYRSREAAESLLKDLMEEGYRGAVESADLGERGTWFRVRIGPFRDEADAEKVMETMRKERNLKGFIVR